MRKNNLKENIKVDMEYFNHMCNNFTKSEIDMEIGESFMQYLITDSNFPIITPSGQFHADEVFSIALIMLARITVNHAITGTPVVIKESMLPYSNIIRRGEPINDDEEGRFLYQNNLIIDIKNGHFDHHMKQDLQMHCPSNPFKKLGSDDCDINSTHSMATIGCLWNTLGPLFNIKLNNPEIVKFNVFDKVYWDLINVLDIADVYGPSVIYSPLSILISSMNGCSEMEIDFMKSYIEDDNAAFYEAIMTAYKILRLFILKAQRFMESFNKLDTDLISVQMSKHGVNYLQINPVGEGEKDPFIPLDAVKWINNGSVKFIVNRNPCERDGTYRCIAVDSTETPFDPDVQNSCNGIKFYHPQNFLITFNSLEDQMDFVDRCGLIDNAIGIYPTPDKAA